MFGGKDVLRDLFGSSPVAVIKKTKVSRNKGEIVTNKKMVNKLNNKGYSTKSRYADSNGGISDGKIKTWGGTLFYEAKNYLNTRAVLNDLIGKMRRYMKSGNYSGGIITIYFDAREDLLNELYQEVSDCNMHFVTGTINVIIKGKIIKCSK